MTPAATYPNHPEHYARIDDHHNLVGVHALQPQEYNQPLRNTKNYGQISRVGAHFHPTKLAILPHLIKSGYGNGKQLHYYGRDYIRHDIEREDSHPAQGTPGEHIEDAENAGRVARDYILYNAGINSGNGDISTQAIHY
ncbi:hypothetical protein GH714_042823 [Hevea brasiliensis]|uniref:Uncharacterized protein n=1 Tax=Hevea brasiliensis TaxID=3981 RepID=A0A6A6K3M2_HEVBR|nr:hypothetical protein GH714_042823 [Hevea brasiliensis]